MKRPPISRISDIALLRVQRATEMLASIEDVHPAVDTTPLRIQLAGLAGDLDQLRQIERGYNEIIAETEEMAALLDGKEGRPN